jgi:1,4-dihydroxy-2-naphthoate octaprenyltransferase
MKPSLMVAIAAFIFVAIGALVAIYYLFFQTGPNADKLLIGGVCVAVGIALGFIAHTLNNSGI